MAAAACSGTVLRRIIDVGRVPASVLRVAEARILRYYVERNELRAVDVDELAMQLVITVIGSFADHMMSSPVALSSDTVPAELKRHVELAMQHIVQGITEPEC